MVVDEVRGVALLVYDGDCGFCRAAARWIAARWRTPARAVAWQRLGSEQLGDLGLSVDDVEQAAWWVAADGRLSRGHRAVARALVAAGGWRAALGRLGLIPPFSWAAAVVYLLVARYRRLLPGARSPCRT